MFSLEENVFNILNRFKARARNAANCQVRSSMERCSVLHCLNKTKVMARTSICYCWHVTNSLQDIGGKISKKSHLFLLIFCQKNFIRLGSVVRLLPLFRGDENVELVSAG